MIDFNQIFYQIYPLGLTGAPRENDGITINRISRVKEWIPHLVRLGVSAVYFGPVFSSDRHGYDTRDYRKIDERLGTNEDFADVAASLHEASVKVVLDGVFNHVGRGFFGFRDVLAKKRDSAYRNWFNINFDDTNHPDGFWYEGWEGHQELVKLNLKNEEVRNYLFCCLDEWIARFHIDGLRLDVAYMIDRDFLRQLKERCRQLAVDFMLIGEMINGDYNVLLQNGCDAVTNYECRKGIFSSLNSANLCEIGYSLNRQFADDPWCLYTGRHLLSFLDNHDVDRFASVLSDPADIILGYDILFAMPGMPCIYYGSEWGIEGKRTSWSDKALRPQIVKPEWNGLTEHIAELAQMRRKYSVFTDGDYHQLLSLNRQLSFTRRDKNGQLFFAVNIDTSPCRFDFGESGLKNLLTGEYLNGSGIELAGKSAAFYYRTY